MKRMIFIFACILTLQSFTIHTEDPTNYKKTNIEQHIEKLNHNFEIWKIRDKTWGRIRNLSGALTFISMMLGGLSGFLLSKAEGFHINSAKRKQMATIALLGIISSYSITFFSLPTFCIAFVLKIFSSYTVDELRETIKSEKRISTKDS